MSIHTAVRAGGLGEGSAPKMHAYLLLGFVKISDYIVSIVVLL